MSNLIYREQLGISRLATLDSRHLPPDPRPPAGHPTTRQRPPTTQRHANARPTPGPHPDRGQRPCDSPPPSSLVGRRWARTSALPHSLPGAPWLLGFALSAHSAKKPCEYTQASSPGVAPRLSPHNQLWGAGTPPWCKPPAQEGWGFNGTLLGHVDHLGITLAHTPSRDPLAHYLLL